MRVSLQGDLDRLEATLQEEGDLVRRALRGSVQALERGDLELAAEVIAFDDEIDLLYLAVETRVEELLARQTPVASDLRLTLAILHANLHLERMADYCVTIAKHAKLVAGLAPDPGLMAACREMADRADEMIAVALDSLRARDAARAETLVDLDELIDRANRRLVERVIDLAADPGRRFCRRSPSTPSCRPVGSDACPGTPGHADDGGASTAWGVRMILVSRCLERIGDHAVDVGEQVSFLVSGEFREFTDASHL